MYFWVWLWWKVRGNWEMEMGGTDLWREDRVSVWFEFWNSFWVLFLSFYLDYCIVLSRYCVFLKLEWCDFLIKLFVCLFVVLFLSRRFVTFFAAFIFFVRVVLLSFLNLLLFVVWLCWCVLWRIYLDFLCWLLWIVIF